MPHYDSVTQAERLARQKAGAVRMSRLEYVETELRKLLNVATGTEIKGLVDRIVHERLEKRVGGNN